MDHISVLYPDVDTPFVDGVDVVQRLLPYHVFQLPREELVMGGKLKGKCKATDQSLLNDIKGSYFYPARDQVLLVLKDGQRRILLCNASDAAMHCKLG